MSGYILLTAEPLKEIFSEQKQINGGFSLLSSLYTESIQEQQKSTTPFCFYLFWPKCNINPIGILEKNKEDQQPIYFSIYLVESLNSCISTLVCECVCL